MKTMQMSIHKQRPQKFMSGMLCLEPDFIR
jgi:hypothetical protein